MPIARLVPLGERRIFPCHRTAKNTGTGEAWSTNYDIFLVPIDGSAPPQRITSNPAADMQPHFSPDGKTLADLASSHSALFMKTGSVTSPRPLPDGRVLFAWSSLQRPAELYLAGLDGGEGKRITKLNDDQIVALRLGKVGSFSFIGEKGRTVHGRLIYPAAFDSNRKYPVVFVIHGGPETSNLNEFNYRWNLQVFAGAGYAVIAIDYPGSTGYGQAFTDAVSGDWGGAPYRDLMTGLSIALKQYPFLDGERMGVLGPSFGGYMVNWIAGHQQHPFRCFVSHAGIFDRERFF